MAIPPRPWVSCWKVPGGMKSLIVPTLTSRRLRYYHSVFRNETAKGVKFPSRIAWSPNKIWLPDKGHVFSTRRCKNRPLINLDIWYNKEVGVMLMPEIPYTDSAYLTKL